MERLNKQRFEHIQMIFEEKTGVTMKNQRRSSGHGMMRTIAVAGTLICLITVSVFTYGRFSDLTGDEEGKWSISKGEGEIELAATNLPESEQEQQEPVKYMGGAAGREYFYSTVLRFEEWMWPTDSQMISAPFGLQSNGTASDHINIAGSEGDAIYSVAAGTVSGTGFDRTYGNYVEMDFGDGVTVRYGHLKKLFVEEGEKTEQGQKIGELGKTGLATGPNLSFAVYIDGEAVNPLIE